MHLNISQQHISPIYDNSAHIPHNYVNKKKRILENQLQQRKSKEYIKRRQIQICQSQQRQRNVTFKQSLLVVSTRPKNSIVENTLENRVNEQTQQNCTQAILNVQKVHKPQTIEYKKKRNLDQKQKQESKKNVIVAQNYPIIQKNLQKSFKQLCYKLRQQEKTKWEYLKPLSSINDVLGKYNSVDNAKGQNFTNVEAIRNRRKMKRDFERRRDHILNTSIQMQGDKKDRSLNVNNTQQKGNVDFVILSQSGQKLFVPSFKSKERKQSKVKYSSKRNNSLLPNLNLYWKQNEITQAKKGVQQFTNVKLQIDNKQSQKKKSPKNIVKQSFQREYSKSNTQQHQITIVKVKSSQKAIDYKRKKRNSKVNTKLLELKLKDKQVSEQKNNNIKQRQYATLEPKKNPITFKRQVAKVRKIKSQINAHSLSNLYSASGQAVLEDSDVAKNNSRPSKINLIFG